MSSTYYRCYFTDDSDRIKSVEEIDCEDDASAVLKAERLLAESTHKSAELWNGKRLVGKWANGNGQDQQNGSDHAASK